MWGVIRRELLCCPHPLQTVQVILNLHCMQIVISDMKQAGENVQKIRGAATPTGLVEVCKFKAHLLPCALHAPVFVVDKPGVEGCRDIAPQRCLHICALGMEGNRTLVGQHCLCELVVDPAPVQVSPQYLPERAWPQPRAALSGGPRATLQDTSPFFAGARRP